MQSGQIPSQLIEFKEVKELGNVSKLTLGEWAGERSEFLTRPLRWPR